MIIYKATNKKNNKIYIGQTINTLNYRKQQPLKPLMKYLSIKDLRSIFICFSVKNKKELLNCLKSLLL